MRSHRTHCIHLISSELEIHTYIDLLDVGQLENSKLEVRIERRMKSNAIEEIQYYGIQFRVSKQVNY